MRIGLGIAVEEALLAVRALKGHHIRNSNSSRTQAVKHPEEEATTETAPEVKDHGTDAQVRAWRSTPGAELQQHAHWWHCWRFCTLAARTCARLDHPYTECTYRCIFCRPEIIFYGGLKCPVGETLDRYPREPTQHTRGRARSAVQSCDDEIRDWERGLAEMKAREDELQWIIDNLPADPAFPPFIDAPDQQEAATAQRNDPGMVQTV